MNTWLRKTLGALLAVTLVGMLIGVIWQPVFPSGWIVKKMADRIDPETLDMERPVVVRFDLSGKGGGVYNMVVQQDRVDTVKGEAESAHLILYMEARDFNSLMFALATGRADEYTVQSMIISKVLRFAGDMGILEKLFEKNGEKGRNKRKGDRP